MADWIYVEAVRFVVLAFVEKSDGNNPYPVADTFVPLPLVNETP